MAHKLIIITLAFFAILTGSFNCTADNPYQHSIGGSFSPKACFVSWEFYSRNELSSHNFLFGTDLYGVINGRYSPGYKVEYFLNYDFKSWQCSDGLKINFYSGPGAMAGFLRDIDNDWGFCAGLCGDTGFSFNFKSSFKISIGFSGSLAYHVSRKSVRTYSVNLYKNGILTAICPVVGIRYVFR